MNKVSVIVPVYNTEKYLYKCLNSLINQTLKQIEIIIVNDGSKDSSDSIIKQFMIENKNIVYIKKDNGGLSSARNVGIDHASGEYIAFVDSDDWVETDMYEKMYLKAKENNFDLVMCDFNEIHQNKAFPYPCHLTKDLFQKEEIKKHMIDFYPSAWNKIYKKELLENIRFKEGVWFEDVEFGYRIFPCINSIGVVNQHLYNYLIREGSITSTVDLRIYHYIDNWNGILDSYKKNHLYDEYKDELEYSYVRYLFATFIKTASKYDKKEYENAVNCAMKEVNNHFPNYKKNKYLNKFSLKNLYLKAFGNLMSRIIYRIYRKK